MKKTLEQIMREDLILINQRTGNEISFDKLVEEGEKRNQLYQTKKFAYIPQDNGVNLKIDDSKQLYKIIEDNKEAFIDAGLDVKTHEITEISFEDLERFNGVNPFFIQERDEIVVKSKSGEIYSELENFVKVYNFSSYLNKSLNENKFYSEMATKGSSDFNYRVSLDFDFDKLFDSYQGGEIRGEFNEYPSDSPDLKCRKNSKKDIEKIIINSDTELSEFLSKRGSAGMTRSESYLDLYKFSRDFEDKKVEDLIPVSKMLIETFLYHASDGTYDRGGWGRDMSIGNFQQYLDSKIQSRVLCGKSIGFDNPIPKSPKLQLN